MTYRVYDERKHGDWFESEEFKNLDEANNEAVYEWYHLTKREQKNRHIYVAAADGSGYAPEGAFDSDRMR